MKMTVTRDPGDKQGPDINDPLLSDEIIGLARGTREIDYNCSNRYIEQGNCPMLPYMATGSLVNITETSGSYRGKLKSFSFIIDIDENGKTFTANSAITIERKM